MATVVTETPPTPVARKAWLQFSLGWLLLVVVLGCAVAAWLGERRLRKAGEDVIARKDQEIRRLRTDLGLLDDERGALTIKDPKLVHIRSLPKSIDHGWTWHIYLPPGKQFDIWTSAGDVWNADRQQFDDVNAGSSLSLDGEFTLHGQVERDLDGQAGITIWTTRSRFRTGISEQKLAVLRSGKAVSINFAGMKGQQTFQPDQLIELMHLERELDGRKCGLSVTLQEVTARQTSQRLQFGN